MIPPAGSIRGSIFNLAGATLGAGALSIPYAVAVSGLLFALAQLVLASFLTVYTIRLLMRASRQTGLQSYEDLALHCFGKRVRCCMATLIAVGRALCGDQHFGLLLRHFDCLFGDVG